MVLGPEEFTFGTGTGYCRHKTAIFKRTRCSGSSTALEVFGLQSFGAGWTSVIKLLFL